jgi:hypothetical protein
MMIIRKLLGTPFFSGISAGRGATCPALNLQTGPLPARHFMAAMTFRFGMDVEFESAVLR